jgi:hypothetical protein
MDLTESNILIVATKLCYFLPEDVARDLVTSGATPEEAFLLVKAGEVYLKGVGESSSWMMRVPFNG